jgi:hypothetical protein
MGGIKLKAKCIKGKNIKVYMNLIPACTIDKDYSENIEKSYPYVIVRSMSNGYILHSGQQLKLGKM